MIHDSKQDPNVLYQHARMQKGRGGGGPDPPPTWDLSEIGSCVDVWWVGEGGPKVVLILLL